MLFRSGAKLEKTKPLDGFDFWPVISEGKPSPRQEIVYNVELFRGAVRNGDWKLFWRATLPSKVELFNVTQDRSEKTNLAEQQPEKVRELQKRIDELAGGMAKSMFLIDTFRGYQSRTAAPPDRKSTRLNSSHIQKSRMPSSA